MAKLATLRDDFNDNSTDTSLWTDSASGVVESGGQCIITPSTSFPGRTSASVFDGTNSEIVIAVPTVTGTGTTGSLDCGILVQSSSTTDRVALHKLGAFLTGDKMIGGVQTNLFGSGTYSTTAYRWWRIRETSGTLYLEVAATAAPRSWTVLYSGATPFDFSSVRAYLYAGYSGTEASPGTFVVETVNPILLSDLAGNAMVPFSGMAVTNNTGAAISASESGTGSDAVAAQTRTASETATAADSGSVAVSGVGLRDLAGNLMAPFSGLAVTNNTPTTVVPISASDAGAGVDAVAAQSRSVVDQGGTGTAPNVYDSPTPYGSTIPYDSATIPGSGENASATIAIAAADSGSGVDAVVGQSRTSSDLGAGVESATSIGLARSETASALDAGVVGLAVADVAVGTDAQGTVGPTTGDVGSASDLATNQGRTGTDAGVASETAFVGTAVVDSDAGVGSDSSASLVITGPGQRFDSDSGAGAETSAAVVAALAATDAGVSIDGGFVVVTGPDVTQLSASESAGATEAATVAATASVSDVGAGVDAELLVSLASADAGAGTEGVQVLSAALSAADTASGAESSTTVGPLASDAAFGIDQFPTVTSPVLDSDSATAADSALVCVQGDETGTGTEGSAVLSVTAFDTALGVDQFPLLLANVSARDLAIAAEGVAAGGLAAALADVESGVAFDNGGHTFDPPTVSLRSVVVEPRIVSVLVRESETV